MTLHSELVIEESADLNINPIAAPAIYVDLFQCHRPAAIHDVTVTERIDDINRAKPRVNSLHRWPLVKKRIGFDSPIFHPPFDLRDRAASAKEKNDWNK